MAEEDALKEGYQPPREERGYQPQTPQQTPTGDPNPQGGYRPTDSGDNPPPPPPKED